MSKEELLTIKGGSIGATMLNTIVRLGVLLLELGRSLGTAIKRTINKTAC